MDGKSKYPHPSGIPVPRRIRRSTSQPIPPRLSRKDSYYLEDPRNEPRETGCIEEKGWSAPQRNQLGKADKCLLELSDGPTGTSNSQTGRGAESGALKQSQSCDKLMNSQPQVSAENYEEIQVSKVYVISSVVLQNIDLVPLPLPFSKLTFVVHNFQKGYIIIFLM